MKFALVNGVKTEAAKGLQGNCPICDSELIPKCGQRKKKHWSHKAIRNCDPWWEPETEWHRSWKNKYPNDLQEVILYDHVRGEKHIADIRTAQKLVIEFQHSALNPLERATRENFYKNMVWVVDGTRLIKDYPRFQNGKKTFRSTQYKGLYIIDNAKEAFPISWLTGSVAVIFDFKGLQTVDTPNDDRQVLYCLFNLSNGKSAVFIITREDFIKATLNGTWEAFAAQFMPNRELKVGPVQSSFHAIPIITRRQPQWFLSGGKWRKRTRL